MNEHDVSVVHVAPVRLVADAAVTQWRPAVSATSNPPTAAPVGAVHDTCTGPEVVFTSDAVTPVGAGGAEIVVTADPPLVTRCDGTPRLVVFPTIPNTRIEHPYC